MISRVISRVLAALALFFVFAQCALAEPEWIPAGESRVFVPNEGQNYIHFELVSATKATRQAEKVLRALSKEVEKYFHMAGPGDDGKNYAKCVVRVHQVSRRDIPAYRLSCWSIDPLRGGRQLMRIGEAASPVEALKFNEDFAREHLKRGFVSFR